MMEDLEPENCIEEEYRRCRTDRVYAWKASRMLSRQYLAHFATAKVWGVCGRGVGGGSLRIPGNISHT